MTVVERVSEAELAAAHDQALRLVDDGRFTQAAEVLSAVVERAAGRTEPAVLDARLTRALALFLGNDYRRALPEFLSLSEALAPDQERMLECRRQAAYCRAELGDIPAALRDFRALLTEISRIEETGTNSFSRYVSRSDSCCPRLGHATEAEQELGSVLSDLIAVYGPDDPEVMEVRTALTRLRASE